MPFIDTVTFIAAIFSNEKHHLPATRIFSAIEWKKIRNPVYSDYILDELLTFIRTKKGPDASNKILDWLLDSEIKLVYTEPKHITLAVEVFRKYPKLSFTDATLVALMMDVKDKEIFSFDHGFDSVREIIRLENVQDD